jgi:hypothetical protein
MRVSRNGKRKGNEDGNNDGTENKTFMVSQLVNVSCPQGDMERKNNDGTETKTYMVSQLVNVSFARKGIKNWNIKRLRQRPAREINGMYCNRLKSLLSLD